MWFSRSQLCGTLVRSAARLRPLCDLIHARLLQSFYLHADETTARVLRPGQGKTDLVYLWVYAGDTERPYVLFDYHLRRSRAGPAAILQNYCGGLMTDGHSAYTALAKAADDRFVPLSCWAHARRGFEQASSVTSHALAYEALAWIGQLYDLEDRCATSTADERRRMRQLQAVPILDRLFARLHEMLPVLRPSSKLAEAVHYVLGRQKSLRCYTTDGRYPIDNNLAERQIRPAVIGRKNYLFFGSDRGGTAASIWYTLMQSARRNHVDTLPYLHDLLIRLPAIVPKYLSVGDAPLTLRLPQHRSTRRPGKSPARSLARPTSPPPPTPPRPRTRRR